MSLFDARIGMLLKAWTRTITKSHSKVYFNLSTLESRITPKESRIIHIGLLPFALGLIPNWKQPAQSYRSRWRENRSISGGFCRFDYQVSYVSETVSYFHNKDSTSSVVVFSGNGGSIGMETWRFLSLLHPYRLSFLVIHHAGGYKFGTLDMGDDTYSFLQELKDLIDRLGIQVSGSYGASGGTLPALYFASMLGLKKSLVVGPSNPMTSPSWQNLISNKPLEGGNQLDGVMLIGDEAESDKKAAFEVLNFFPNLSIHLVPGGGHTPFAELGFREFRELFGAVFAGSKERPLS